MSHSTLDDFYKGMRMPNYDGKNVLNQLKQLQGINQHGTMTQTFTTTKTVEASQVPPISNISQIAPHVENQERDSQDL